MRMSKSVGELAAASCFHRKETGRHLAAGGSAALKQRGLHQRCARLRHCKQHHQ